MAEHNTTEKSRDSSRDINIAEIANAPTSNTNHTTPANSGSSQVPELLMIPTTMGDSSIESVIPSTVVDQIRSTKYFIVENIRTARRFLKRCDRSISIEELSFKEINKRTDSKDIKGFLEPMSKGHTIGVMSEAGCPGVADPGAEVVKCAHELGYKVVPLVGPSSILMAVMASGMNGQSFAFNGYIPINKGERIQEIKRLEKRSFVENQTQLLIEAPYRNVKLFQDILEACSGKTRICVACDISLESEFIVTKSVQEWKKSMPGINKRPAIFIIHKD